MTTPTGGVVIGDIKQAVILSDDQITDVQQTHDALRPEGEVPKRWEPPVDAPVSGGAKEK